LWQYRESLFLPPITGKMLLKIFFIGSKRFFSSLSNFSFLFIFLLLVLIIFFYYQSLNFDYVGFDDTLLVRYRLPYISNPARVFDSFKESVMYLVENSAFYYRPILTVSFVLDSLIFKDNFWGYHLTNILLHILSVILVNRLLLRLKIEKNLSLLFTLIFALHPVLMQAVVWVPGRNDSLLLIFSVSAFLYFLNYLESSSLKDFLFFVFFVFLAVFVKETSILFLPLLLLYSLLFLKREANFKRLFLLLGSFFLVFVIWYAMASIFSDKQGGYWHFIVSTNWPFFIPMAVIPGFLIYLGKIFLPFNLSVLPIADWHNPNIIFGIVFFLFILFGFLFFTSGRRKMFIFGVIWFFLLLLPTFVDIMPSDPLAIYEHRLYLPIVGLFISLSQVSFVRKIMLSRRSLIILSVFFVIFFFLGNRRHVFNFKDPLSFWESAYFTSPQFYGTEVTLSGIYLSRGDFEKAEKLIKEIDRIKPDSEVSHLGYASLFYHKGEYEKSLQELDKVLKINPRSIRAMQYLASIKDKQENYDEAEKYYLEAISIDDKNVDLLMSLVAFYIRRNEIDKAKEIYKRVQELGVYF